MQYTNVTNPQWADAEHTVINCTVDFVGLGSVPFTANPNDTVNPASKEIFDRCVAGDFGSVAAYAPPAPYVPDAQANKANAKQRLADTDWVNEPDVIDPANTPHLTNQAAFLTYRSAVRAIAVNPVDGNLDWPTEPVAQWA